MLSVIAKMETLISVMRIGKIGNAEWGHMYVAISDRQVDV